MEEIITIFDEVLSLVNYYINGFDRLPSHAFLSKDYIDILEEASLKPIMIKNKRGKELMIFNHDYKDIMGLEVVEVENKESFILVCNGVTFTEEGNNDSISVE